MRAALPMLTHLSRPCLGSRLLRAVLGGSQAVQLVLLLNPVSGLWGAVTPVFQIRICFSQIRNFNSFFFFVFY